MTLQIRDNCCTDTIKIHPITAKVFYIDNGNYETGVHLFINKRQVWTAYYYRFADCQGWQLSHGMIRLRLTDKEFREIFGDIEILGRVN